MEPKKTTNNHKVLLYVCLLALLFICIVAVVSLFKKDPIVHSIERIREIRDDSISYWKDRYNVEHANKQMAEAELNVIKLEFQPLVDTVLSTLKIQGDQLRDITALGIKSTGRVRLIVDTVFVDSSRNYNFKYKDEWINIAGSIGNDSYLDYETNDSLIVVGYTKKKGFLGLGRKEVYIDAHSLNPNSRIKGLQGVRVLKERAKRFGAGPYIGIGYNGQKWVPQIGFGVNYSLLRF